MEGRFSVSLGQPQLPYQWYVQFRQFDLRPGGSRYFFQDPRNFAYLSGFWTMQGNLTDWWSSRGQFRADRLTLRYTHDIRGKARTLALDSKHPASILFEGGNWRLQNDAPLVLAGDLARIEVGMEPGNPPRQLSFYLDSELNAASLPLLFSQIESAKGKLQLKGRLEGPADRMELSAQLRTADQGSAPEGISLSIPDLRPEFRNIDALVSYQKGYLQVHQLSATKGSGSIRGGGTFKLANKSGVRTDLSLTMDQIKVIYPVPYLKSFDSVLSGDLHMSGSEPPWLVSGDIVIDRSRSTRRFDLREEVINVMRKESLDQGQEDFSPNPMLRFNVNFLADQSITIHNNNMRLTLSSDLRLQGDEQKQIFLGHVDVERGKFIYKKEFDIQRGELSFGAPNRTDPKIDLVATAEVSPYKVTVAVSGPVSRPVVELLVDPPTHDDGTIIDRLDAILLLTRGSLPKQEQHSAEATGLGISEVLNVYASQIPFDLISEKFGKNYIHIYPDITTEDNGSPAPRLNVPVKIYNDIEAVYRKTQAGSEVTIEVPVHNNISLSGSFNEVSQQKDETNQTLKEQGGSVDLQFRFPVR